VIAIIVSGVRGDCDARTRVGRRALAVPTDVMDTAQIRALNDKTMKELGRIDILVNNVGGSNPRPFMEQSERSWRRHIDINLVSVLAATSAAVSAMIAGGRGGSIITSPASRGRAGRLTTQSMQLQGRDE